MHKKDARDVVQAMSKGMGKLSYRNSVLDVCNARGLSFGEYPLIALVGAGTGLSSGSQRAVRSGFYTDYLVTARLNFTLSRIIGLIKSRPMSLITLRSNI
jgi:hypothetical protein